MINNLNTFVASNLLCDWYQSSTASALVAQLVERCLHTAEVWRSRLHESISFDFFFFFFFRKKCLVFFDSTRQTALQSIHFWKIPSHNDTQDNRTQGQRFEYNFALFVSYAWLSKFPILFLLYSNFQQNGRCN